MTCLTIVSFSIMVNGVAMGRFRLECGIRRGDPLSPYLFILCAEGLTALLRYAEVSDNLHGVSMADGCSLIAHLFFYR